VVGRQKDRTPGRHVLGPAHLEPGVGEGLGSDEGSQQVVGLEAEEGGDPGRAVPVLHRPPPGGGHGGQAQVRVDGVGVAHAGQERHVEQAVRAGMAGAQIHPVLPGPLPGRRQLAHAPHEPALQAAGVAAIAHLVPGGQDVVEPEGPASGATMS